MSKTVEAFRNIYKTFKDGKHVFIFSPCGRCSTTGLQRILNSSNEITVWGESWGVLDIFSQVLLELKNKHTTAWKEKKTKDYNMLVSAFLNGKHEAFYANAFKDLDIIIQLLQSLFTYIYSPIIEGKRIGFKEIYLRERSTLDLLKELYPNSKFVFLFRDPVYQYNSAQKTGFFNYSYDVNLYISEFIRMAKIYLNFMNNNPQNSLAIENVSLFSLSNIERYLDNLSIASFDRNLVKEVMKKTPLIIEKSEIKSISDSECYDLYQKFQNAAF